MRILPLIAERQTALGALATLVASAPLVARAAIGNICDVLELVGTAADWFSFLIFIIATLAMLYAGFLFLTSGGDEEQAKQARNVLIYGLIGIAVALLALAAVPFVRATVGGNVQESCPGPDSGAGANL